MSNSDSVHTCWTDDAYDRHASDGRSRYGVYLAQHRHRFTADPDHDEGDDIHQGIIADPVQFAVACWHVATGPLMSPPYVDTHPRVVSCRLAGAVEVAGATATVTLAAPLPESVRAWSTRAVAEGSNWWGWCRQWGGERYRPPEEDRMAMLSTLELRIPIPPNILPRPTRTVTAGVPDLQDARGALRAVIDRIQRHVDPVLATLETLDPGGRR